MKILKWTTVVQYIDKETGEAIPKEWINQYYSIIKTIKTKTYGSFINYQTNEGHTKGVVTITNECRRINEQLKLF